MRGVEWDEPSGPGLEPVALGTMTSCEAHDNKAHIWTEKPSGRPGYAEPSNSLRTPNRSGHSLTTTHHVLQQQPRRRATRIIPKHFHGCSRGYRNCRSGLTMRWVDGSATSQDQPACCDNSRLEIEKYSPSSRTTGTRSNKRCDSCCSRRIHPDKRRPGDSSLQCPIQRW